MSSKSSCETVPTLTAEQFAPLVNWYNLHQRILPWRTAPSPYATWISEIMLQQTQVATVIDYFLRFIAQFPTVQHLAKADLQQVLKLWEGLGYYSRARNLHKAARYVVDHFNGQLPQTFDDLQTIPGIGPYTAAAIASIAFQQPIPVVDGNVFRVYARLTQLSDDIRLPKTRQLIFNQLTPIINTFSPREFNQAMMELGALICTPKNPQCNQCPMQSHCGAAANQTQTQFPYKSKLKPSPHYHIAVALIFNSENKILIAKRDESQMLGGLWEFPGGKQEANESLEETAIREVKEETNLTIESLQHLTAIRHTYSHFSITLTAFLAQIAPTSSPLILPREHHWISADDLSKFPFPTANKKIIDALHKHLSKN